MKYNTAGQYFDVIAFNASGRVSGDEANITCELLIDDGAPDATNDVNPSEIGTTGQYRFTLTEAETLGYKLTFTPVSSTSGVQVLGQPSNVIYTSLEAAIKAKTDLITSAGVSVVPALSGSGSVINVQTPVGASYNFTLPSSDYSARTLVITWELEGSATDTATVADANITKNSTSLVFAIPDLGAAGRNYQYSVRDASNNELLISGSWVVGFAALAD